MRRLAITATCLKIVQCCGCVVAVISIPSLTEGNPARLCSGQAPGEICGRVKP